METWLQDLKHGVRVLLKARAFTAVAVLSLALGIGANSAIFSVADGLLLRPLPYSDDERLAMLWQRSPGLNVKQDWFSIGQYLDIREENTVFEGTAAAIGASFNLTGNGQPERVDGVRISSSFFPLLGARPIMGRVLTPVEDTPGNSFVVILSHGFWTRRFGADTSIIGKTITLNGNPSFRIIGVLSPDFRFNSQVMPAVNGIRRADLFLPLPVQPTARSNRGGEDFNIFAKLKPGISFARAQSDMDRIAAQMKTQYPANYPANGGLTVSVVPLIDQVVGDVRLALKVLLGAVGFVLLIACANVANLLLARATVREKELAIRSAVGAHRRRLLRQLLTENLILACFGGAAGLVLAHVGVGAIRQFGPANIPRMDEVALDARVLLFTFGVSIFTGLVFGLLPAMRASTVDPNTALKEGGRGTFGKQARLRKTLVAVEVALSLILLIGAGLLIRSYERISRSDPGFDATNVLSLRMTIPGAKYSQPALIDNFYRSLETRVAALPGVQHVGFNYQLPLSSVALAWEPIGIEGYVPPASGSDLIISSSAYVSPDYFKAMGIRLKEGRFFTHADNRDAPTVAIVDDKLAGRFWPKESAIGKRLRQGSDGPWRTIVGVVIDSKQYEPDAEPPITTFFPVYQYNITSRFLVVRTSVDAATVMPAVASVIRELDPDLPTYDVNTMEGRLHDSFARRRLSMFLLVTFASVALLLAVIGLYGVISYWVQQRTREIGIRIALGAERSRIIGMIFTEFGVVVGSGLLIGLVGALAMTRLMQGMLFGVAATDLLTYGLLALALAGVAAVATWVPARRALAITPLSAVRHE
jgi:predicted permease